MKADRKYRFYGDFARSLEVELCRPAPLARGRADWLWLQAAHVEPFPQYSDELRPAVKFHALYVAPYDPRNPEVMRIYLNHYETKPAKSTVRRWMCSHRPTGLIQTRWNEYLRRAQTSFAGPKLELSILGDELVAFAPWVACWVRAHRAGDPTLLPVSPHPVKPWAPANGCYDADYIWSTAAMASDDKHRSRCRRPTATVDFK